MKKSLVNYLVLSFALTTMTVSTAFASNNQSNMQQQQIEQIRQQNDALNQQNEYLKQQTAILQQQSDSLKQNQAYTQGYIQGQGQGYQQTNNHYQLYTGMGVGYMMGQWFRPCYGRCGWGHRCWH